MSEKNVLLKVKNISHCFGKEKILKNISFEIKDGDFLSIYGTSGAGKSTLLHIISSLLPPSSGKVFFENQDIFKMSEKKRNIFRNKNISFVFQEFYLSSFFTVKENINTPMIFSKTSKKKTSKKDEKIKEILDKLKIKNIQNKYPHQISGGQKQRVAIGRALIAGAKIIFADEPTGNLDTKTGKEILDIFENLNKNFGISFFIASHDERIKKISKKSIFILDGKIS